MVFGDGLVTALDEKHKKDRAIFGKYFIRSNIIRYVPRMNDIVKDMMTELDTELLDSKSINIEAFFASLSLRIFTTFAFSTVIPKASERKFCHLVSKGSNLVGLCAAFGLQYDFIPVVKNLRKCEEFVWKELYELVLQRKAALARGEMTEVDDVLNTMIDNKMTDAEIREHSTTMVSAGHDTTAFFSSYLCYLLSTHPDVQEKVRQEIKSVVGDRTEITPDDVSNLKYLTKVMMETLRLYAVIPVLNRCATEDVYFKEKDITIRKGTEMLIPLYILNRDPDIWEKPSEFNPDRFEAEQNYTSAKQGFFPFGYGTRVCIGNTFAQIETAIFTCYLLRKYKMTPAKGFKPQIMSGISLTTSNGMHLQLEPLAAGF